METQTVTTNPSATGATPTPGTVSIWQIDPAHSLVEFSAKHMMFATVKGRFGTVRGTITAHEPDHTASKVEVEIDAASIDTRDEKRDAHLRSADFLDVEHSPTLTFTSSKVEPLGGGRLRVTGNLTIRGVTRPVVLEAEETGRGRSPWGQEVIGFSARTEINRKDWGLNWNVALEAGGVLVSEKVKIDLEIEATRVQG